MALLPGGFALLFLVFLHRLPLSLGGFFAVFLLLLGGPFGLARVFPDGAIFLAGIGWDRTGYAQDNQQHRGRNSFHNVSGWEYTDITMNRYYTGDYEIRDKRLDMHHPK
jgi:hypothetical protein